MVGNFRPFGKFSSPPGDEFSGRADSTQVITLASLVERETRNPVERRRWCPECSQPLAPGFPRSAIRRRRRDGVGGHDERTVRSGDLRIESPRNTYEHRGLRPGPIANPGEASLRARLSPQRRITCISWPTTAEGILQPNARRTHRNVARHRHLSAEMRRQLILLRKR